MEDSALAHQQDAAPPKLPMPPAQKLKALQSLLCQLQQKLKQMPQDPVCSHIEALEADLPKDASYMARIYLKNQKEIAQSSIKVTFAKDLCVCINSIWIGTESYHPSIAFDSLIMNGYPRLMLQGKAKKTYYHGFRAYYQ